MVTPASSPGALPGDADLNRVSVEGLQSVTTGSTLSGSGEGRGTEVLLSTSADEKKSSVNESFENTEILKEERRKEAGKGVCLDDDLHRWGPHEEGGSEITELDYGYSKRKGSALKADQLEASTSHGQQPPLMLSEEGWENDIESEWESLLQQARRSQHTVVDDEDSGFVEFWQHKCSSLLKDCIRGVEDLSWRLPLLGKKDCGEEHGMKDYGKFLKHTLAPLALGQLLSFLVTVSSVSAAFLSRQGINVPTTQSFLNYVLLSAAFIPSVFKKKSSSQEQVSWYVFFILAALDVEANYLVVKAYQYTPITSVMLLDAWTIPCVLLLTWLLLRSRYNPGHFWGVAICMAGLAIVVFSDVHSRDQDGKKPLLGDMLVLIGATLYGFCNVIEEFLASRVDKAELVGKMGLYGTLISFFQLMLLERAELATIRWNFSALIAFVSFGVALFLFYIIVPFMLQMGGSALFNLSLLTSDMWGVAVRSFWFHQHVDWLYFVALATVAGGLCIYSCSGEPSLEHEDGDGPHPTNLESRTYQVLDVEEEQGLPIL